MHGRHRHRHGHRMWWRRVPDREALVKALEERQRDLEEEIADIHDLLRRLRDDSAADAPPEPVAI